MERARLTRQLARIAEERGNGAEAAEIMQEVAVETYGALSKEEKVAFVLEQVRLVLDRGDYVRAQILAKKVNPRTFVEKAPAKEGAAARKLDSSIHPPLAGTPTLSELKLIYFRLMVRYHLHANDYLEVCRAHQAIYEAPEVAADAARWQPELKRIALFCALSPRSPMQQSLLAATLADKKLSDLPAHAQLLRALSTHELVDWPALSAVLEPELGAESPLFDLQGPQAEVAAKRRADLALRVVEHNVHTLARYYSKVSLGRLAELLSLSGEEAEKRLCAMVSAKAVRAKLDRPAGVVSFVREGGAGAAGGEGQEEALLNAWGATTEKLLHLVEVAVHKMHKDATTHRISLTAV